jgi:hypothetical protein
MAKAKDLTLMAKDNAINIDINEAISNRCSPLSYTIEFLPFCGFHRRYFLSRKSEAFYGMPSAKNFGLKAIARSRINITAGN